MRVSATRSPKWTHLSPKQLGAGLRACYFGGFCKGGYRWDSFKGDIDTDVDVDVEVEVDGYLGCF